MRWEPDFSDPALSADIPFDNAPLIDTPSKCCRLARARIEPVSDWQFQFPDTKDTGFVADILAVPGWSGDLVELVVWKPEAPHRWWLRSGTVPLLGEDLAELAQVRGEPIRLVESPAAWFEAVNAGRDDVITVLDWSADPRLLMTGLALHASPAMARRLKQWWREHAKMNFSVVVEGARRAA